jgi:hypothetical protein
MTLASKPPPTRLPAVFAEARRHDVGLRRHLVATGSESRLRVQLASRRWQAPFPGVVVLHNGPLTDAQHMWSALLAAPPGAMLHGLSALQHDGFRGFDPEGVAIVVPGSSTDPRSRRLARPAGARVRVRWSRELTAADVNDIVLPPRTRSARSLLDAASERVPERRARAIVLAGIQQRLARPAALWDALSRRGRCRNRAMIAESIDDAAGGVQSLPEREFELIRRRIGLPRPARQRVLRLADGRHYLDNEWDEVAVRAEVHGLPHLEVRQWDEDLLLRQNDITVAGGGLLVFSSYAIRHRRERVADQLVQMFRARGWAG